MAGRKTKYQPEFAEQAKNLCLLGGTDSQLADLFDVDEQTITNWKKKHPEFKKAITEGKIQADAEVAAALFKRAIGFSFDQITYERIEAKIDGDITNADDVKNEAYKKRVVTKFIPGDIGAQVQWLKNRQRGLWSDFDANNLTDQQLDAIVQKIMRYMDNK